MTTVQEAHQARHRRLRGPLRYVQGTLLASIPTLGFLFIANVHMSFGLLIFTQQWVGLFLALAFAAFFLTFPATKHASRDSLPWYDALLAAIGPLPGLYIALTYPTIVAELGAPDAARVVLSGLTIFLILEAIRRTVGWMLLAVVAVFIVYAKYGSAIPGFFSAQPTDWDRLLNYLYVDPSAMLGMLQLAATIALAFITFGQLLLKFGVGSILTNVALLAFGRFRGGTAKASMLGSSLVGTVTGAPMSNVFLTGTITIPMMIKSGYKPSVAAGIEATVSTGGQIMPPVMGIAAFVLAENLGMPYAQVALAALIPAVLFYLCVYVQIDLEAGRLGLAGLSRDDRPAVWATLRSAWILIPVIGILIYTLFVERLNPPTAAVLSTVGALPFLLLVAGNRKGAAGRIIGTLQSSGRVLLEVAVVLGAAGVVVGTASLSGLGFRIGHAVVQLSGGGGLALILLLAAVASIFLGMGMPTVAAYALVAVLVAPALVDFGITPIAAHLFIFYFAVVANITPPIAVAAFASAPLAGTTMCQAAMQAMRIGVLIYVVPFLFVFDEALLLLEGPQQTLVSVGSAVIGVVLLGAAIVGYLARRISWLARAIIFVCAVALIIPATETAVVSAQVIAVIVAAAVLGGHYVLQRRSEPVQTPA